MMLRQGVFDFYDVESLEKVGELDFAPMLVQKCFCLSEDYLFAYQAEKIMEPEDPDDIYRTIGKYFRQSIGIYDFKTMKQADMIDIPQDIYVKYMHFRKGRGGL